MDKRTDIRMPIPDPLSKNAILLFTLESLVQAFNESDAAEAKMYTEYSVLTEEQYTDILNTLFWFQSQIALMNDYYNHINISLSFGEKLGITVTWADASRNYVRNNAK